MTDIKLIIVGVDGSESSRAALHWAYEEATHHGASLTVVMSWHSPSTLPMSPPYGTLPTEGYESQPRTDAINLLEKLTSELEPRNPAVDVRTSLEEGSPAKVLIERSKGADLLVVGSRGHGGFAGMLLGSVSQHLVGHAECPVTVVR
ncbi:MAG TPA: universal stress protein [Propionibacteriaceae bacterium]|nr:universal stress protein [Propionibacteriaceae bacterium]